MADFKKIIPHILKNEGGLADHPKDPGGLTNRGITIKTWEFCAKEIFGIPPTRENLKKLTAEQAAKIYEVRYWNVCRAGEIQNDRIALQYFDFFVNAGNNATRRFRSVLIALGCKLNTSSSQRQFIEAINSQDPDNLFKHFKAERLKYYNDLVALKPHLGVFLKGWIKRVEGIK